MVCLLLAGFILWLSSPLIMEFLEYANENVFSPIGEWIRNLLGLGQDRPESAKPFVVSEYLARIEKASLDILESRKPVDKTVVLRWGLDGLRLNEDGTMKWVSRKKPAESVFYQPCQTIRPDMFLADQTQSTRAQIDALMARNMALQIQPWQARKWRTHSSSAAYRLRRNIHRTAMAGTVGIPWNGFDWRRIQGGRPKSRRSMVAE